MRKFMLLLAAFSTLGIALPVTAQQSTSEERLEGEVVRVEPSADRITVRPDGSDQVRTFTVDDDTEINFEGRFGIEREGALREIESGDEVVLVIDRSDGSERVRRFERDRRTVPSPAIANNRQNTPSAADGATQRAAGQSQRPSRLPSTATPLWIEMLLAGTLLLVAALTLGSARRERIRAER